ncbi:FACT complex subunit [Coelomomyces lativittatus]|nr:FACT complex subunit [Coelomomyces lativittatus]KAJ1516756.1 FACT complex subunit [Coelomomyces lativittatus]
MSMDIEAEGEDSPQQKSAADYLCEVLKSKADLGIEKGDNVVSLKELPFLTPRGRYDVDMLKDSLRLRGKSYDYKITYAQITMLFLLPKPDDFHFLFVLGLDPPLRQGQTRYPFLVLQFVRDEEMAVNLNLDAAIIADQYAGRLQKSYDAPTFEVVSSIFQGLTNKKIIGPGQFRSAISGSAGVKCSLKANEGYLYALEKSFLFVPKPATYMAHTDISYATFSRVSGGSSRTIDLVFSLKQGSEVSLSNISREEYTGLEEYLKMHKVKVKNELNEESRLPFISDDEDGSGSIRSAGSQDEEEDDSDASFVLPDDEHGSDSSSGYDSDASSGSESDHPPSKRNISEHTKPPSKKAKKM